MVKRGTDEDIARDLIEEVTSSIPQNLQSVMCGDWNARIGELCRTNGETGIPREGIVQRVGSSAPWVKAVCEMQGWYILNGLQPGPPARNTYEKGTG